jgi:alkaline phosphatase D
MKRRDFLRTSGWFVVGATLAGIPGCGDDDKPQPPDPGPEPEPAGTYQFPQGVASADPRPGSVVLWTRIQKGTETGPIELAVQVATDAEFRTVVVDQQVTAAGASDHTVRVLVTGLEANTEYHYRFVAGGDQITGRTRTAPAPGADVPVNLAWVSCQDYGSGHYGAYRQMIVDDDARPAADRIHFVIHLGDVIYETRSDNFQQAIDDQFRPIALTNPDGTPRAVAPFPSGGGMRGGASFANTVEDYRHLYRTFLSDPEMQAARARWPFVQVWDDHEFTNDSWQSQSNYTNANSLDEAEQARKLAASQAWFEYIPTHLTGATGVAGVPSDAKDFTPATVSNAMFTPPNDDNFVTEPNNAAAVGAMTIYRSLRFGKHVELVMTDQRSYRSDHAIPEELTANQLFFDPRAALPLPIVNTFDQGKTANNGMPPDSVLGLPNARKASPVGTMLGARQKAWWKATMKGSDATWKLWGNEVPLMRLALQRIPNQPFERILSGDAWDGYPTERNELMTYLRTEGIRNVVVLTGDIHAAFAGVVMDNYDGAAPQPVSCELAASGISSNSLFSFFEEGTRPPVPPELRALITVDASASGGSAFTENFNLWLRHGTNSAGAFAQTKNLAVALSVADPTVNPHLKYADTNSQGYGYAKITGAQIEASLVTINRPIVRTPAEGPGIKRTAAVTIPKDNPAGMTVTVTGTKPFPLT